MFEIIVTTKSLLFRNHTHTYLMIESDPKTSIASGPILSQLTFYPLQFAHHRILSDRK